MRGEEVREEAEGVKGVKWGGRRREEGGKGGGGTEVEGWKGKRKLDEGRFGCL